MQYKICYFWQATCTNICVIYSAIILPWKRTSAFSLRCLRGIAPWANSTTSSEQSRSVVLQSNIPYFITSHYRIHGWTTTATVLSLYDRQVMTKWDDSWKRYCHVPNMRYIVSHGQTEDTMGPSQYKNAVLSIYSHYKDKTVSRPFYLLMEIPYMKRPSLYQNGAQVVHNRSCRLCKRAWAIWLWRVVKL